MRKWGHRAALGLAWLGLLAATAPGGEPQARRRVFVAAHASAPGSEEALGGPGLEAAMDLLARHIAACRERQGLAALLPGAEVLRAYLDRRPQDAAVVVRLVRAGRLEGAGRWAWAAPSLGGGEALVRRVVAGSLSHRELLGKPPQATVASGRHGSSPQLSLILASSGFGACVWTDAPEGDGPAAWWQLSPGGTRLLHVRAPQWRRPESLEELRRLVARLLAAPGRRALPADLHLLASDSAGPLAALAETLAEVRELPNSELVPGGPNAWLRSVADEVGEGIPGLPTLSQGLPTRQAGAVVSRGELKIANRLAEARVLEAERFATIAWLVGAAFPDLALDKAWRLVLRAQGDGAITGTGGQAAYLGTLAAYREALELATESLDAALRYLGRAIHTTARPGVPVAVFNPLSWRRSDVCRVSVDLRGLRSPGLALVDEEGESVPVEIERVTKSPEGLVEEARVLFVAREVPPLGFRVYHLGPAESLPAAPVSEEAPVGNIENEFFRVSADAAWGGGIVRILDKGARQELMRPADGHVGNELVLLRQAPGRQGGARELWTSGPVELSTRQPTSLEIRSGPVAMSLTARGEVGGRCTRRQSVVLYHGVPRIECTTELSYRGAGDLVGVTFPVGLEGLVPVVEDRFCVQAGRWGRRALDYRTAGLASPSGCRVAAANRWAGLGASVRVAFADREARVLASFHLGPTAVVHADDPEGRQAAALLQRALAPRGVPCTAVPAHAAPEGLGAPFRIALAIGEGNAYAQRLLESLDAAARQRLAARAGRRGYACAVCRDVAVPVDGEPARVLLVLAASAEALEKAIQDMALSIETTAGFTVPADANFAGVRTIAPDYGLALLNQGTLAHSFEPDGRLALLLMHTAPWPSEAVGRPLVPERGVRVFRYALYPHGADWREAAVHRAALAFNHPLLARVLDRHDGPLGTRMSFVSLSPANVVLSALKPAGRCLPSSAPPGRQGEGRGLVLRLWEAYGEGPCDARIRFFTPVRQAWLASPLDEPGQPIEAAGSELGLRLSAASIHTVLAELEGSRARLPVASLDTTAEPVQPVPSRYWRDALAVAPLGNQPVAITMDGEPRVGRVATVRVTVANNTAEPVRGTVWLKAPKLWDVEPQRFDYRLPPRGHVTRTAAVGVPTGTRGGLLAALTQHAGQTYRDSVVAGPYQPLEATVQRTATELLVRIRNPNPFPVAGRAEGITSLEAWPGALVGPYSRWAVRPRVQGFQVAAEAEGAVTFTIQPAARQAWDESFWAVIKLTYDGRTTYATERAP